LYDTPIEVLRASDGRLVVVGQPERPRIITTARALTMLRTRPTLVEPRRRARQMFAFPFMVNAFRAGRSSRSSPRIAVHGVASSDLRGHTLALVGFRARRVHRSSA